MADISAEPSMEEILSSIKRIIAEEGDPPGRPRRSTRAESSVPAGPSEPSPEILELNTPAPLVSTREPEPIAPEPPVSPSFPAQQAAPPVDPAILSREAVQATRGSLDSLSRLVTRPEPGSDGTLEGLVRDMLRPILREWLDANLPQLVETMVAREIAKITGSLR